MKDFWVGRLFQVACSFSKPKHPCYFQNKHQHFQKHLSNLKTFSKDQHFVYILTNENHYKVCLNDGAFSKYFQKTTQSIFSNKSKWSSKVTKSPWKTMDEKGANTFPFNYLPPKLKKTSQRSFLLFSTFPFG